MIEAVAQKPENRTTGVVASDHFPKDEVANENGNATKKTSWLGLIAGLLAVLAIAVAISWNTANVRDLRYKLATMIMPPSVQVSVEKEVRTTDNRIDNRPAVQMPTAKVKPAIKKPAERLYRRVMVRKWVRGADGRPYRIRTPEYRRVR